MIVSVGAGVVNGPALADLRSLAAVLRAKLSRGSMQRRAIAIHDEPIDRVPSAPVWRWQESRREVESVTRRSTAAATAAQSEWVDWSDFHNPNLDVTIRRVAALLHEDEEDEAVQPTEHAVLATLQYLIEASALLGGAFPRAAASGADDGGIRLFWREPGRSVQLTIPAHESRPVSVYHREGTEHATERHATPQTLAH